MVLDDEDVTLDFIKTTQALLEEKNVEILSAFNYNKHGECLHIDKFLSSKMMELHGARRKTSFIAC